MIRKGKLNNKGFTLVELLAVIVIIMLIAGIGTYAVIRYINTSKNETNKVSINSVKETGISYVKENRDKVMWVDAGSNIESTCVSFTALINEGYYKENLLSNDNFNNYNFVKVNRDKGSLSILNGEISDEAEGFCDEYYVKVPTCANPTYNGIEQNLLKHWYLKHQALVKALEIMLLSIAQHFKLLICQIALKLLVLILSVMVSL